MEADLAATLGLFVMVGDVVHRPRWGVTTEDAAIRTQNAVQEVDVAGMGATV